MTPESGFSLPDRGAVIGTTVPITNEGAGGVPAARWDVAGACWEPDRR